MSKVHSACIEQAVSYEKRNGDKEYKYKVSIEDWNNEKKKYDGWKDVTVFSSQPHKVGEQIYFCWRRKDYGNSRYEEFYPTDIDEILNALDSPINLS